MARGSIQTIVLGKIHPTVDGQWALNLKAKPPRIFSTEEAARKWKQTKAPKSYKCYITVPAGDGKLKQKTKSFSRKKDADEWLDRHSTDVREGTYREIRKATFGEYAEHYRATHLITQKPSTLNAYLSGLHRHILPEFEHMAMQSISPAEINRFKARLLTTGKTVETKDGKTVRCGLDPKTVRNLLNFMHKSFSQAVRDGYLRHSPMADNAVEQPKVSRQKKGRGLKPVEAQELLKHCEGETRLIVLMAILTGMRRGEVFGLRWQDVDWKENVIHVRQSLYWRYGKYIRPKQGDAFVFQTPKSDTSVRDIDLSPELKKELRARYLISRKTDLVFQGKDGRPLDPNRFAGSQFVNAVKGAELGKVRFHDLRHTFAALKIEQGENIYYIQRQMGHSSIQVTIDTYGHLLEARKPAAAAKTDALLFASS